MSFVRNQDALCEQALSIREHNRRRFLRHGTDWTPDDFASVLDDAAGRIVAHPRRTQLSRQWTEVAREAREHPTPDCFDATRFGRRVVGGIFDDFTRRHAHLPLLAVAAAVHAPGVLAAVTAADPAEAWSFLDAEPVEGENLRPFLESLLLVEARYPRPQAVVAVAE